MSERKPEEYIGLGLIFGMLGGIIFDNIALGLVFGVAIGAALSEKRKKEIAEQDEAETDPDTSIHESNSDQGSQK